MNLSELDRQHIWHPFTVYSPEQLPLVITSAKGAYLYDEHGKKYLDAVSSWWVNIHGHAHPYIAQKIYEQYLQMEHIMFAGFTHPKAVELAERLSKRLPSHHSKLFFSDNGSTAVEVGLKIALQFWKNRNIQKNNIIAFTDAYHGDTFGAMSVSGRSLFTSAFHELLFEVDFIPTPVSGNESLALEQLEYKLQKNSVAAFIFEPCVLGAGGMLMYSREVLEEMLSLCQLHGVICIADEVMTGFGRTGSFFVSDTLAYSPDIICLSKGITGGCLPLGLTSVSEKIYTAFMSSDFRHTFWHGHSYTANAISCAAACASLDLFETEQTMQKVKEIEILISEQMRNISSEKFVEIRQKGTIAAFEFKTDSKTDYTNQLKKEILDFFLQRGIIVRPLGNVLYFMPPYCINSEEIQYFFKVLEEFIKQ